MTLLERIDRWAHETPDRPAFVQGERTLTYRELIARSRCLAHHLVATLPDGGAPVAVVGHKDPELLVAFLAVARAGRPYVPIDTIMPTTRIERIQATAGASYTLTPERIAAFSADWQTKPEPPSTLPSMSPRDPFYIMFTSGSTGDPKGVVITLGNLEHFLNWMLAEQRFEQAAETFLNQVSYSFDVSFMDTFVSLLVGGTIVAVDRDLVASPRDLYATLARSGLTTWVSTPSFAQICLVERSFDQTMLPHLRRFLFCGEPLSNEVASKLLERFPRAEVWNTYGPTEATVATTSIRVDQPLLARYSPLPIGQAMPGTRVLVLDEQGAEAAPGQRGELVIAGPNVSPGYLGRPDLTARAFFQLAGQPAYRTGDWGRQRDGLLFCEGRIDSQVKLHGYRVELGDVESNLRLLPTVQDAIVAPIVRAGQVDSLAAFVILRDRPPGSDFQLTSQLRTQLAERLPVYMLPRKIIFVESFPMTANGKADRRQLAESLP
jgi:D-alanine--poly(phosphoribitol) ligase subunit 1